MALFSSTSSMTFSLPVFVSFLIFPTDAFTKLCVVPLTASAWAADTCAAPHGGPESNSASGERVRLLLNRVQSFVVFANTNAPHEDSSEQSSAQSRGKGRVQTIARTSQSGRVEKLETMLVVAPLGDSC